MATIASACSRCGAVKKIIARGLCSPCYLKAKRAGERSSYEKVRLTFEEMLAIAKVNETPEGCWPWPSVREDNGYPHAAGGHTNAYVSTYVMEYGPVPDGFSLDHLCHSRSNDCKGGPACKHRRCVRPSHLEPATAAEQQARRPSRRSSTCTRGHAWTEENTYWFFHRGKYKSRRCRQCDSDNAARRYSAQKRKT